MSGHRIAQDLAAGAATGVFAVEDPGDGGIIGFDVHDGICEMVSGASAETRTLDSPPGPGLRACLRMKTDGGGNIVVTATSGLNVTGNTSATFGDAGDLLELISVSHTTGYRWEILVNTGGVTLLS